MRRIGLALLAAFCLAATAQGQDPSTGELKQLLLRLEAKVENLGRQVEAQTAELERLRAAIAASAPVPPAVVQTAASTAVVAPPSRPPSAAGRQDAGATAAAALLPQTPLETPPAPRTAGGFRFNGDFRYRFELQARHPNDVAPALQNARARYRLRLNADRPVTDRFLFHLQLASGPLNNTLVNDQDFTSGIAKHLFTISEAYIDYQASPRFRMRGGRMEDLFDDDSRFLFDHDARFNGFHQIGRLSDWAELRAGQYIFTNPAVLQVTPSLPESGSPLALAGARIGSRGRSANLFHQGIVLHRAGHELVADLQLYRNPSQLELSVVPAGIGFYGAGLGVQLAGPFPGLGNATTTPGGAQLTAGHYQVLHLAYKLSGAAPLPRHPYGRLEFQVSRNLGAGSLRDALMATAQLGRVKKLGDVSGLYLFTIKDANSMLGPLTDVDLGSQSTVNIRAHHMRVDVGLAPFLQLQNLIFIANFRRASNPAENFFVPFQRGAHETVRYQSQLQFVF